MYRRFLRPGWFVGHFMVVLAVLVCLRLGWWQWDRTHEASGTIQNLGYAILWPIFGAAFIYMWIRFLQLELLKDAEDDAELAQLAAGGDGTGGDLVVEAEPPAVPSGGELQHSLHPDPAVADVLSEAAAAQSGLPEAAQPSITEEPPAAAGPAPRAGRGTPSRGYTVASATVGDEDEEQDSELAAYNRALAALAEKDHRRAR